MNGVLMRDLITDLRQLDPWERLWLLGNTAGFLTLVWLLAVV